MSGKLSKTGTRKTAQILKRSHLHRAPCGPTLQALEHQVMYTFISPEKQK